MPSRNLKIACGIIVLAFVVVAAGGVYFGLVHRQPASPPQEPTPISPQDVGLPKNAEELQKEIEKTSGGKTQMSFALQQDFPKDFPVCPGSRVLSSIRYTQEGLSFLTVWATDDELEKVQTFYEVQMQQSPWKVLNPFTPGIAPAFSEVTLTFGRTDAPTVVGLITLAKETTGRGETSIDVSYTKR